MITNTKHINDYNLVHRYLCGDEKAGQELYASIFLTSRIYIITEKSYHVKK